MKKLPEFWRSTGGDTWTLKTHLALNFVHTQRKGSSFQKQANKGKTNIVIQGVFPSNAMVPKQAKKHFKAMSACIDLI